MRWLLACLIHLVGVGCSRFEPQVSSDTNTQATAMATTPCIYHCRSPNMEHFTCWWHPVGNISEGEEITYRLNYKKDKGPMHDCPDYVSGGANSCHFDSSHTSIWNVYCMTVTAVAARWNSTSKPYCVDVADIVQTEAPVNMSYVLREAGGDETGHSAFLSWSYPVPEDLRYGWITLVYEVEYRHVTEPNNWKVKQPQRESQLELMGLPGGEYLVRVRCRSRNYGKWSKWSSLLQMAIPVRPLAGKMLILILVAGIGVATLLVISFGVIPQGKRIKAHFLPPIPKPRIGGIDPLLLKKGKLDEIDYHFRTFHSYSHPILGEEVWNYVSTDSTDHAPGGQWDKPANSGGEAMQFLMLQDHPTTAPFQSTTSAIATSSLSVTPYCGLPPPKCPGDMCTRPITAGESAWPAMVVALPMSNYSQLVMQSSAPQPPEVVAVHHPVPPPPQDFYTCMQLLSDTGEVNMVPCLTLVPQASDHKDVEEEKKRQLADYPL